MVDILSIINEELKNFDFLSSSKISNEQENVDLLLNEELQKQFICDSLLKKNEKVKIIKVLDSNIGGDVENTNRLSFEYNIVIEYLFDISKQPLTFELAFDGNNIKADSINTNKGYDYNTPPEGDKWFDDIDWKDVDVYMYTNEGDTIKFKAFIDAPTNIKELFIKEYLYSFIVQHTSMDIKDGLNKSETTQYC